MASMKKKVAILHPDLGIGGAERLIVDIATGLIDYQQDHVRSATGPSSLVRTSVEECMQYSVDMYTSHYDPNHSFPETRQGRFPIKVYGDWIPRQVYGMFHIIFAMLRNVFLALSVSLRGPRYDLIICDQVRKISVKIFRFITLIQVLVQISICIPILKIFAPRTPILFYCHFPDQLLVSRTSKLKRLYRLPFDVAEQVTTGLADRIVVNSRFTKQIFMETFTALKAHDPTVLYPCIDLSRFPESYFVPSGDQEIVFLSINRYERKKNIQLAVDAFAELQSTLEPELARRTKLVIAGGYDKRVQENVDVYSELMESAKGNNLQTCPESPNEGITNEHVMKKLLPTLYCDGGNPDATESGSDCSVGFLRSFTDEQKTFLLQRSVAVLYTPTNEHFGIVPIECMAMARPVIAVNSGGPRESVVHEKTGFLCEAEPEVGYVRRTHSTECTFILYTGNHFVAVFL
eukprot:gb/GECG01004612.1/.p1 GENE.gb/GECG01004612.1/~~gb/GECG01004612.1/.p1  ORF type:complete len:461 (+),score=34.44 gb/GECG01004612.1/:1-1383(+)